MTKQNDWNSWLNKQSFNSWKNYVVRAEGNEKLREAPAPEGYLGPQFRNAWNPLWTERSASPYVAHAEDALRTERVFTNQAGRWIVPNRLDVMDFGNEKVYCAIGAYAAEESPDLTRIIKVCGPQKRVIPLSPPHYDLPGGNVYKRVPETRCLVMGIQYEWKGKPVDFLFRHAESQIQQRIRQSGIVVSTVTDGRIEVSVIDFAPLQPSLALISRVVFVKNTQADPVSGLRIKSILTSSKPWPVHTEAGGRLEVSDAEAGHGLVMQVPGATFFEERGLFANEPEAGWQNIGLVTAPIDLEGKGSHSSWMGLVPTIAAGDEEQDIALAALPGFQPLEALEITRTAWLDWSKEVVFDSDNEVVNDLVDSLQVLLKTHEGVNGYHLGTTYQIHTHGWVRDNYLIQRGLLAGGRVSAAKINLDGFFDCWKKSGVAVGYHVFSRRDWSPRPTAELYAYLILMVRDYHWWMGDAASVEKYWPMVEACAEGLYTNEAGLAGFDGDEIWYWELDQQKLWADYGNDRQALDQASVLDNCWLSIAALEYAAGQAGSKSDAKRQADWLTKKENIQKAVEARMWSQKENSYHSLLMPDGSPYRSPFVNGLCTPQFWGITDLDEAKFAGGVRNCWNKLHTSEGIVRGNTETSTYAGLTPGFFLHALATLDAEMSETVFRSLLQQIPSSGGIWEYTVVECPVTFSDKRRGGDSGVLLAAVLHYLLGFTATAEGFTLNPHLPSFCTRMSLKGIVYRGMTMNFGMDQSGTEVEVDGKPATRLPAGQALAYSQLTGQWQMQAQADRLQIA